jgi:hypothetical protein
MSTHKVIHVPETPYLVFVLALAAVCVIWGFLKAKAFMYFGVALVPLALLFLGTTTISNIFISRKSPWGQKRIDWDEVVEIEVLPYFYWVVLNGREKRLAIVGPAVFDTDRDDLPMFYLEEIAEQRGIPIRLNPLAMFKGSKGA